MDSDVLHCYRILMYLQSGIVSALIACSSLSFAISGVKDPFIPGTFLPAPANCVASLSSLDWEKDRHALYEASERLKEERRKARERFLSDYLTTSELRARYAEVTLSPSAVSFLCDVTTAPSAEQTALDVAALLASVEKIVENVSELRSWDLIEVGVQQIDQSPPKRVLVVHLPALRNRRLEGEVPMIASPPIVRYDLLPLKPVSPP